MEDFSQIFSKATQNIFVFTFTLYVLLFNKLKIFSIYTSVYGKIIYESEDDS